MDAEPMTNSFNHHHDQHTHNSGFVFESASTFSAHTPMDAEMEVEDDIQDMGTQSNQENNFNFPNTHFNSSQSHQMPSSVPPTLEHHQRLQPLHSQQLFDANSKRLHSNLSQSAKQTIKEHENSFRNNDEDGDDAYDEEDDEDDLDDLDELDEQIVQQMLLNTTPENQQAIRLLLSGFSACASETVRYLIEEERMPTNSPVLLALVQHLKMQETMLIVSCLRTQHLFAQQQQQQQSQMSQLSATSMSSNNKSHTPSMQPTQLQPLTSTPVNSLNAGATKTLEDNRNSSSTDANTFDFTAINRQLFSNNTFNDSGFSEQ